METKTVRSGSLLGLITSQAHLKPVVCLETSPPRDKADGRRILEIVARAQSRAEFVTVTDTGSSRGARAIEAAIQLRDATGLPVIAHLACTGRTRDDFSRDVDALLKSNVDHVLVLRGDSFVAPFEGFAHADEAIAFLHQRYPSLTIGAACYPSGHPEDAELGQDIRNMQRKVQAGASFFGSQLVFSHVAFRDHVLAAAKAGIGAPILPGIPVVGELARLEQDLRGNAAGVQAGTAERVAAVAVLPAVDTGNLEAVLCGADGRRVAGRAAADHDQVKGGLSGHGFRLPAAGGPGLPGIP